jgi:hypothetical protein
MGFFDNKIDVSGVPDSVGSEPLPEGEYLMKATEIDDQTPSKSSGADMLTVTFSFVDPAHASRRSLNDYFVVGNQIAYSKLKKWMRAVGIDPNPEITKDMIGSAMGRQFKAKLVQEEYNGYINNKLNGYFPSDHESTPPTEPAASTGDVNQQAPAQPSENLQKAQWS